LSVLLGTPVAWQQICYTPNSKSFGTPLAALLNYLEI